MSAKARKAVADARAVADDLEKAGAHRQAEIIRRVCRGSDSYVTTLAQLHKDNMNLREHIRLMGGTPDD